MYCYSKTVGFLRSLLPDIALNKHIAQMRLSQKVDLIVLNIK